MRYLKSHPSHGLLYETNSHLRVEAYIDADWAGSPLDRKATTGYCSYVRNKLLLPDLVQRLSDTLCWRLKGNGKFDTWSFYHEI